jgi:hypothetical protein
MTCEGFWRLNNGPRSTTLSLWGTPDDRHAGSSVNSNLSMMQFQSLDRDPPNKFEGGTFVGPMDQ